jgi:SAM-dependent methyltransferase
MRLAFAVAANLVPDLLLIDEVVAVGDVDFQQRCVATMQSFRERGCTILFVSHSTAAVTQVCDRAVVLEAGALSFDGALEEGLAHYQGLVEQDANSILPGASGRPGPRQDPETWPHRLAMAPWSALGPWARDLLKTAGMTRQSFVLDVGCGSLPVGVALLPELDQSRYWGYEFDRHLLEQGMIVELRNRGLQAERGHFILNGHADLSLSPHLFDLALGHSLSIRVTPEQLGVAVAAVVGHLAPGGKFFLSLPKDREDQLGVVRSVCATIQAQLELTEESRHPRGEAVWLISRG